MGKDGLEKPASPQHSALRTQHSNAALVIFTKAPIPGEVKTRLCPPLTPDEAASLHGSFVLDAVERSTQTLKASQGTLDRYLACAPSQDHVFFKVMEGRYGLRLIDQVGEDLGARMGQVFESLLSQGYQRVLLVGTDVPTLPGGYYSQALQQLETHDLVLGAAQDGGYHLIGLTRPAPELFAGIPWSTEEVLPLTLKKAETLGLKTAQLPVWRDVDTIQDLEALIEETGLRTEDSGLRRKTQRSALSVQHCLSERTAGALRLIAGRLEGRKGK